MTDIDDRPPADVPPVPGGGRLTTLATSLESRGVGVDPEGDGGVPYAGLRLAALVGALALVGWWRPWMLVVILALFLMITLHEFGHFIMAKRAGMKVTEFFIFFGPKVWSIKRGETEYGIKCIPLGAYVKIVGMHNLEEVDPADEARTYRQKGFWDRIGVAVAGSAMHFLLALVLIFLALTVVGLPGGTVDPAGQAESWRIANVADGGAADAAGLQSGDEIVSMGGDSVSTFEDLREVSLRHEGETVPLVYERDGVERTTQITLVERYDWRVAAVADGTPPAAAGMEPLDRVTAIGDLDTTTIEDLEPKLLELEGTTVPVTFVPHDDDGNDLAPRTVDLKIERLALTGGRVFLGVGQEPGDPERLGVGEAVVQTPVQFAQVLWFSTESLGRFFTPSGISDFMGQVFNAREDNARANPTADETSAVMRKQGAGVASENRIMSIVGLVNAGSAVGEVDPSALIFVFALVNIFIGVFNLFPMLPFDGGHVVIAVYERIQEKRLHRKRYFMDVARLLPAAYAVMAVLVVLFATSLWLDLANPIT
ncbi:MAG: site-2 protease family protein [Actinobacteria bacterium]|nr:site-2 protease family protein [Actinomycetota bacterium]